MNLNSLRLIRLGLLALAATWLLGSTVQADNDMKPVKLVIKVPADAALFIDGKPTGQTGTERKFESPPVPVGKNYFYMVKGVWKGPDGKEVVKETKFRVKAGQTNELDLQAQEATPPSKPVAKLKLIVPAAVDVEVGGKKTINVKVDRANYNGPVKISFSGVPAGAKLADLTIPEDKDSGKANLSVSRETREGTSDLTVQATGEDVKTSSKIKLTVKEAAPPAKLSLTGPSSVDVAAGTKKTVTLKIGRENYKGAVKITFSGAESIKVPDAVVDEDQNEAKIQLAPAKTAKSGAETLKATATGGGKKAELAIKVNIMSPPKEEKKEDKPKDKPKEEKKDDKPKDTPPGEDIKKKPKEL